MGTLTCAAKIGGLSDTEFESILNGRTALRELTLLNCERLSENLFPRWCNRSERREEAEIVQQLDQDLLSSFTFGQGLAVTSPELRELPKPIRRRQHPRTPPVIALRSLVSFALSGAAALPDRSADALAELLHDAQVIDLRGCPGLTEEA